MAAVDSALVVSDLLAAPNGALDRAAPIAHLPALQRVVFASATMGYGDLFAAALLGALLASLPALARRGVAITALIGLAMDLLFLVVHELPATVPVALALLAIEARSFGARRRARE